MVDPADKPPAPPAPSGNAAPTPAPGPGAKEAGSAGPSRRPEAARPEPEDTERQKGRLEGLVPDIVRRAVVAGVGALFMTEEGIRNLVSEVKLPREAMGYLIDQARTTRQELARVITDEVRRFLESERLSKEIWRVLSKLSLEIKAEVRLKPTDESPTIKTRIKVNRDEKEESDE